MRNVENRMHSFELASYYLQNGGTNRLEYNNAFIQQRYGGRVTREGHLPNFSVNNFKYQQRFCGFMTRIAYMYTSSALPSEEIRNFSTN